MFNNSYMPNYNQNFNQQSLSERIDNQIAQLNQMKDQIKNNQQPAINQTFQLASNQSGIRYANNIDEVQKDMVMMETAYFSKDMSVVWVKNSKGEIKTYELNEVVLKDEKDIKIDFLQAQIEQLKKEMKKNEYNANFIEPNEDEEPTNVPTISKPSKKSK